MCENEAIEKRVRKLLALARNNPSVEEAATAFALAQDMAARHGLDLDDLGETEADTTEPEPPRSVEPIVHGYIDDRELSQKAVGWRATLGCAIARGHNCKPYLSGPCVRAAGQPSDLALARVVFLAAAQELESLAVEAVKRYKAQELDPRFDASPRAYGGAWRQGFADAVAQKIGDARRVVERARAEVDERRRLALAAADEHALAGATVALVRVERADEYLSRVLAAVEADPRIKAIYSRKSGRSFSGGQGSAAGYAAGRQAGAGSNIGGGRKALR